MKAPVAQPFVSTHGGHEILPVALSTPLVCLAAAALVAAWYGLHRLKQRVAARWLRGLLFAARLAVGFLALLAAFDAMQRGVVLATNWPIWPLALGGAVVVEVLLLLYALERRLVTPRTGVALAALRVALALLVVGMLAQPVRSVEWTRRLERFVAVLVDRSASMHVPDNQMTPAEKVRLAEVLSPDAPQRPTRFEEVERRLREARETLGAHADWLASVREAPPEGRLRQLESRRRADRKALVELEKEVAQAIAQIAAPLKGTLQLDPRTRATLAELRDTLGSEVGARLADAAKMLERDNLPALARDPGAMLASLRAAASTVDALEPKLVAAGLALDEAFHASLPADQKAKVDAVSRTKRFELARRLLEQPLRKPGSPETAPGLLEQLRDKYGLRLYAFDSKPVEIELEHGLAEHEGNSAQSPEGHPDAKATPAHPERQMTDLAAALEKVITEMPADRLAGILLLTDGQHNAPSRVEPLARRIGLQQVPICSIVFGAGARPTTDAAVVSLEAPEAIYVKDKMYLNATVKLGGMAGKTVRVTLYDGDRTCGEQIIRVEGDSLRTRIQLADEPKETGLHAYRVKIEDVEGEVLATNNESRLSVSVSDEQTRMLVLAGRARWEFRYLKNLFASRDHTVELQYVLLHPDRIPGQPPRPVVHASAARDKNDAEATAPPENEAEWMKFDVIVLGDIEPSVLRAADLEAIRKFVTERAGTLIVVAGPRHMPHAYADTPLAEMLPVSFAAPAGGEVGYVTPPERSFRVALTAEGRGHVIMRLKVDAEENLATWNSLPEIHWRHPLPRAKAAATVLAYAMPPEPPEFLIPRREHEVPTEEVLAQRRQFVRGRALISLHHIALGRVLFLSFDRTWRLRYRVGDRHHHRFWGQVLHWATADKLAAGTHLVKIGTDRPIYPAHTSVRVRAKITKADFSPIVSDTVVAKIFAGDRLVLRKKMAFVPNSLGGYAADLGPLPGGTYRFELEAPDAASLLAAEGVETVSPEFFVQQTLAVEQVELAADRGLLERLATLTGGIVADPPRALDTLAAFGAPTLKHTERRQWSIWDSWPFLALIVLIAGAEWFLRKRARLP